MSPNLDYFLICVKEQSPPNTMKPLPHGVKALESQEYLKGDKNQDGHRELNEVLRAMLDGKPTAPRRSITEES